VASRFPSLGAALLALTLPPLFTHIKYQPKFDVGAATVQLADIMVLIAGLYALVVYRHDLARLRPARALWIAIAALFGWILIAAFYGKHHWDGYRLGKHLLSAAKWEEYVLLAIVPALVLRRRRDERIMFGTLAAWTALAAFVGVTQFLGAGWFAAWGAGSRQPSFIGTHDLAAVGGAALLAGLVALTLDDTFFPTRRWAWACFAVGLAAFVLGGASAGIVGLVPAGAALLVVARGRHLVLVATVVAAASIAVLAIRSKDVGDFARFLGLRKQEAPKGVQTYAQRTMLAYLGVRVWRDYPVLGVGWHGTDEFHNLAPYMADVHRRYPNQVPQSYPAPNHPYGVQTLYLEALADLGVIGFLLLAAFFAVGLLIAWRGPPPLATVGLTWLLLVIGLWTAEGFTSGIPLDGVTWLGVGFAVAAVAEADRLRA
jgi:O-antigen ligase